MLMIGFFEDLPSERSTVSALRRLALPRAFLGYQLDEDTPDHSSLSVIRNRLGEDIINPLLRLSSRACATTGSSKAVTSASTPASSKANASLRELVHRNTEE
jgi:transposase